MTFQDKVQAVKNTKKVTQHATKIFELMCIRCRQKLLHAVLSQKKKGLEDQNHATNTALKKLCPMCKKKYKEYKEGL